MKTSKQFRKEIDPSVPLTLRIGRDNHRRHAEPVYSENGKLKALWCLVDGKEERHPEGVYYLRVKGKKWVRVGRDAEHARLKQQQFIAKLRAEHLGIEISDPDVADTSVQGGTPLKEVVEQYLSNVKRLKAHKTWSGYRRHCELFGQYCPAKMIESITKQHVLGYIDYLSNELELDSRTVHNHYASIGIMLRAYGLNISEMLKRNEKPTYEEPIPDAYYQGDLENLFAACHQLGEDPLVWEFFLGSGFREQEVEHFSWPDIDFRSSNVITGKKRINSSVDEEGRVIKTRKRNAVEFAVKDKEGRAVPLPNGLLAKLVDRHKCSPCKLVFPAPCGKPEGHFLRRLKKIAFRAGLNCGYCINRRGLSCKDHPVCEYWALHKFRRTFATTHHEGGASARKIQKWLGHESLEVTLRYLAVSERRSEDTRKLVNVTFNWLYGGGQGVQQAPVLAS